jgi:hypothetical protein
MQLITHEQQYVNRDLTTTISSMSTALATMAMRDRDDFMKITPPKPPTFHGKKGENFMDGI